MVSFEKKMELEEQLYEAGNSLLNPPSSIDELLLLLDKVESLLASVEQAPSWSMQKALLPLMRALISDALFRHSDMDVKVSVVSCITMLTRITAPDPPYNDERMKEIFRLTVAAFEYLSHASSRCYTKAVSILVTSARVRLCLVMLDLECNALVIKMFQLFLKKIRLNHPHSVFLAMESIMTLVLDESEDISWDLLSPLLASVKKENQKMLPIACKLGEKVIANCADKIKPYLMEAVQSMNISLDEYSPVVASICKSESCTLDKSGNHLVSVDPLFRGELCEAADAISKLLMKSVTAGIRDNRRNSNSILNVKSSKILEHHSHFELPRNAGATGGGPEDFSSLDPVISEAKPDNVPKERGRRPNSLMNAEEGCKHSWISTDLEDTAQQLMDEKATESVELSSQKNKTIGFSSASPHSGLPGGCHKRGRPKKKESMTAGDADPNLSKAKKLESEVQISEKLRLSMDGSLISESKSSKTKRQKCSSRVEIGAKQISAPLHSVLEKEVVSQRDPEEKILQEAKKHWKETNPKSPKTNPKRQQNTGKKMASKPTFGEEIIGRGIKVWWPKDKMFYEGVVVSYNPITMRHKVLYSDGDEENLRLRVERWELIHDKGQETDLPKPDVPLDIRPKQEVQIHPSSSKSSMPHSSLKRNGADSSASSQKSEFASDCSLDGGMLDKPIIPESVKDKSTVDGRSNGDDQKFGDELKIDGNSIKSKKTIPETLPSLDGESPSTSRDKETSV